MPPLCLSGEGLLMAPSWCPEYGSLTPIEVCAKCYKREQRQGGYLGWHGAWNHTGTKFTLHYFLARFPSVSPSVCLSVCLFRLSPISSFVKQRHTLYGVGALSGKEASAGGCEPLLLLVLQSQVIAQGG